MQDFYPKRSDVILGHIFSGKEAQLPILGVQKTCISLKQLEEGYILKRRFCLTQYAFRRKRFHGIPKLNVVRKPKLHLPCSLKNEISASELNVSFLLSAWFGPTLLDWFGRCDFHVEKDPKIHSRKWKVGCIVFQVDLQKPLSGSWYV